MPILTSAGQQQHKGKLAEDKLVGFSLSLFLSSLSFAHWLGASQWLKSRWMSIKKTPNYKFKKASLCLTKVDCRNTWRHLHLLSCSQTDRKYQFLGLPCARNLLTWQTNNTYLHFQTQTLRLSHAIDLANDGAETQE